jgi:hypothetical protein
MYDEIIERSKKHSVKLIIKYLDQHSLNLKTEYVSIMSETSILLGFGLKVHNFAVGVY